jgi:hypothetical protein
MTKKEQTKIVYKCSPIAMIILGMILGIAIGQILARNVYFECAPHALGEKRNFILQDVEPCSSGNPICYLPITEMPNQNYTEVIFPNKNIKLVLLR